MKIVDVLEKDDILIADSPLLTSVMFDENGLPIMTATTFADNVVESFCDSFDNLPEKVKTEFGVPMLQVIGYASTCSVYNTESKKIVGCKIVQPFRLVSMPRIELSALRSEEDRKKYLSFLEIVVTGGEENGENVSNGDK